MFYKKIMRDYAPKKYIQSVEKTNDENLQDYMRVEIDFLQSILNAKNKTFIDFGAGYGRILPHIINISRNIISIDINKDMFEELQRRSTSYPNSKAIEGDIQNLQKLLIGQDVQSPVLLLLQNTLGTIEGDYKKVLDEMRQVAQKHNGEVVISILKQQALSSWGVKFYEKIKDMVGEIDLEKTDFEKGIFVSQTGYTSKWWTDAEINEIKKYFGGEIIREVETPYFFIFQVEV